MRSLLRAALALALPGAAVGCQVAAGGPGARVVPALGRDGVALVWQDGPRLLLQRWDGACGAPLAAAAEIFSSEALVGEDGGLEDAAQIDAGRYAVAWRARGDVWIAVVDGAGAELRRAMASNATATPSHGRRGVRIAAAGAAIRHVFAVSWNIRQPAKRTFALVGSVFDRDGHLVLPEGDLGKASGFPTEPSAMWCGRALWPTFATASALGASSVLVVVGADGAGRELVGEALVCFRRATTAFAILVELWAEGRGPGDLVDLRPNASAGADAAEERRRAHAAAHPEGGDIVTEPVRLYRAGEGQVARLAAYSSGERVAPRHALAACSATPGGFACAVHAVVRAEAAGVRGEDSEGTAGAFTLGCLACWMLFLRCRRPQPGPGGDHIIELQAQLRQAAPDDVGGGAAVLCSICALEFPAQVRFAPCGHGACAGCVEELLKVSERCHICRAGIDRIESERAFARGEPV